MLTKIGALSVLLSSGLTANTILIPKDDTQLILFDIGLPNNLPELYNLLKSSPFNHYSSYILIATHEHYDHVGGFSEFCKSFNDCTVFGSKQTKQVLENGDSYISVAYLYGATLNPVNVSRVLKTGEIINTQIGTFKVIETPGHTNGSLCFYNSKMQLLISGDTVFPDGYFGRTDLPTGDSQQLFNSLETLLKLPVEILIAGHGYVVKHNAHEHIKRAYLNLKSILKKEKLR